MVNIGKAIGTVIIIIVWLSVATALYTPIVDAVENVTGAGYTGSLLLALIVTLYWLLVSAVTLFAFIEGFGLSKMMKSFDKLM